VDIPFSMKNIHIKKTLLVLALFILLGIPLRFASAAEDGPLVSFPGFIASVTDGRAKVVRGVYVPETLALRVMQQPADDPGSVLKMDGVVTQFRPAARNHVVGLLAHNDLAGAAFSGLMIGQEVRLVYGDGRVEYYLVNRLARYQELQPGSQNERYVDLSSNVSYSPQDIFTMFYDGGVHVTFQTCLRQADNASWGRLFVTALPETSKSFWKFQAQALAPLDK
jgi:hypothetical protein